MFNGIYFTSYYEFQHDLIVQSTTSPNNFYSNPNFIKQYMLHPTSILNKNDYINNPNISEPFNPNSPVVVWDLYLPEISCPDMERVGSIGDGT